MAPNQKSRSACLWIGIGCVVVLALGAAVVGGITFWGYKKAQEFKDPVARGRSVGEILGSTELPEGYFPILGLKVPWVMHFAVLTTEEPRFGDEGNAEASVESAEEREFIYVKFLRPMKEAQELEDFFEGRIDDPSVLDDSNIHVDIDEVVRRGALQLAAFEARYVVTRARVETNETESEGLTILVSFDCTEDSLTRVGIWTGPEPVGGVESGNLVGTPGDETEIRAFLGHFSVCH
ncbi:MAG: hypothetical protein K0U98_22485 [Deltaproteobacteria bacterium]|nr:hypothetical protein [Deltaproteobacteria bacterium]